MNLEERVAAALAFENVEFDLDSISPAITDPIVMERIYEALHEGRERRRLIDDYFLKWRPEEEARAEVDRRLRFRDGRRPLELDELVASMEWNIGKAVDLPDRIVAARDQRMKGRITGAHWLDIVLPFTNELVAINEMHKGISLDRSRVWDLCFAEGRIIGSVGNPLSAAPFRPVERVTEELRQTALYLLSDELPPALRDGASSAQRPRRKLSVDEPYFKVMQGVLQRHPNTSVAGAAETAIDTLGSAEKEQRTTTRERLRKNYRRWFDEQNP